jgi:hypothetical protein
MIMRLMPELFTRADGVSPLALFALWHHGALGRHIIRVDGGGEEFERWLVQWSDQHALRLEVQRAEQQSKGALMRSPRPQVEVEVYAGGVEVDDWDAKPKLKLCLQSALRLMERPLQLLVENQHSDGAFLLALHRMLRAWGEAEFYELFEEMRERRDVVFMQGGGITQVKAALEAIHREDRVGIVRTWVMVDHDGKRATAPSKDSKKVVGAAMAFNVPCHQLERRMIENYAPQAGLYVLVSGLAKKEERTRWREALDALYDERMSDEGRWFFHMKSGIAKCDTTLVPKMLHERLEMGFKAVDAAKVFEDGVFKEEWLGDDQGVRVEALEIFRKILERR